VAINFRCNKHKPALGRFREDDAASDPIVIMPIAMVVIMVTLIATMTGGPEPIEPQNAPAAISESMRRPGKKEGRHRGIFAGRSQSHPYTDQLKTQTPKFFCIFSHREDADLWKMCGLQPRNR
jgi:hypothetical protein